MLRRSNRRGSLENIPAAVFLAADTPTPTETRSPAYAQYLKDNTGSGILKVQTTRGQQSYPVKNVRIVIYKELAGEQVVFFQGLTDENGIIDNIVLPAPPIPQPVTSANAVRGAAYQATASHPDFATGNYIIEIFDNIKAILPVNMRVEMGG